MANAGSLIFELAADVSRLRQDMSKAQREVQDSLATIARNTAVSAVKAGWDFASGFARGFADNIQRAIDDADAIGKLSERIGVSTETLSAMRLQAQSAGSSLEAVTNALRGWSKAALDLNQPTSNAAAAVRALGLDVNELQRQNPAQAMRTIAEAMSGFEDGAAKVNAARMLFGRVGDELIPMLNEGAAGFDRWNEKAAELGAVIDQQTARAAAQFNDELDDMRTMINGAWLQLSSYMLPTLQDLVTWFREGIREGGDVAFVLQGIADAANVAARALVGLAGMARAAGQAYDGLEKIFTAHWSELGGAVRSARADFESAQRTMDSTADHQRAMTDHHERWKASLADRSEVRLGTDSEGAARKQLMLADAMEKTGRASRAAKEQISEFQRMLQRMQEDLRTTAADGDRMQMLMTDPRFLQFSAQEQEQLTGLLTTTLELNRANEERRRIEQQNDEARRSAEASLIAQRTHYEEIRDAAMNLSDPLRQVRAEYQALAEARAQGYFEGHEDAWAAALENLSQKAKEALANIDPMKKRMDELKQAVEGFGRQASDAFVDFIFQTGETRKSFGEMVSSMLQDIARLLVYRNVMEPLVSNINSSMSGGGGIFGWLRGLLGRASGGPVNAGQMYRVNETPLRSEFFVPNVPGSIRTSEQMGGGVGDVTVNVNVNRSQTATDVDADTAQGAELGKRLQAVVRQVIAQERRNGGLLSSS